MQVLSYTYAGTGVQQSLTPAGLTWQPTVAIVKGGANIAQIRIAGMGTGSVPMTGAIAGMNAIGIISLDATGFTVGTDATVNANGTTYWAVLLRDNGNHDLAVGSYSGNTPTPVTTNLSTITATPTCVMTFPILNSDQACLATADMTVGQSSTFVAAQASQQITALGAGSFTVGTSATVNRSAATYFYLALVTGSLFATFTYTGSGISQAVPPSPFAFTATNTITKSAAAVAAAARFSAETGNNSVLLSASGEGTAGITAFNAGTIQVNTSTNTNASTVVFYAIAFRDGSVGGGSRVTPTGALMGVGP